MALQHLGFDRDGLRRDVDLRLPAGDAEAMPGKLPFTEASKRALRVCMDEVQILEHQTIGTGHLLLGLLDDPTLQGVLENIDEDAVRKCVLAQHADEEAGERRRGPPSCIVLLGVALVVSWLC
jgi:hypothetical protein